jgi:hypothetical protein
MKPPDEHLYERFEVFVAVTKRMASSEVLHRVALVITDVSEELLGTANVPSSPIVTLMMEVLSSSETSVLTRATWCIIPQKTEFFMGSFMFLRN